MAFGLRWVAPILPCFFRLYPEMAIDLHLSDAVVDLVGEGLDAALRIAVLPDSSLVARKLCPVGRFIVASPAYLAAHGHPNHPRELDGHHSSVTPTVPARTFGASATRQGTRRP
jgi:DNA-binding transcriptional LysR family regulator